MRLLLQRLDRRLVQVHQAGDGRAGHGQEEHEAEQPAERHLLEHLRQHDEQKRGACLGVGSEREHGRHHHHGGQNRGQRAEHHDVARRRDHVHVLLQVAAVDQRAATCQRQAEERLPERKHPGLRVGKRLPARHEQVCVAVERAGQHGHPNEQHAEQDEEQRHHDLVQALDAARDPQDHDGKCDDERRGVPADASEIAGDLTEVPAHIRLGEQGSGCGGEQVLEEPA